MTTQPNTMKLGMAIAFIGAIGAFVSMAMAWNGTVESAPIVGLNMLVVMCFFAVAGSFSTYSPVKGSTVIVLSALPVVFSIIAIIHGAMSPVCGVFFAILGIACIVLARLPTTKDYVEANRLI